jgi:outer membrane protein
MYARAVLWLSICAIASAQAPVGATKVGIINIQDAIIRTEEGQKTAKTLQEKYTPRQQGLEKQKRELDDLQASLNKGRNTMSEEARNKLIREIDTKTKSLQRDNEDASAEFQQEEGKLINTIGQKMMGVIDKYAKEKGFHVILDISSPQSPVLYAVNTVDITTDIIGLYDKGVGVGGSGAAAAPSGGGTAAPAAKPPAPVTRPPAAPPKTVAPKPPAPKP